MRNYGTFKCTDCGKVVQRINNSQKRCAECQKNYAQAKRRAMYLADKMNRKLAAAVPEQMVKAAIEYYQWHQQRNIHVKRLVTKKADNYQMLLVRFIDENDDRLSSLMSFQEWADGHYDVKEIYVFKRECEKENVKMFEETPGFLYVEQ